MDKSGYILTTQSDKDDPPQKKVLGKMRRQQKISLRRPNCPTQGPIQYKYWEVWRRAMLQIKVKIALRRINEEILMLGTCYHISTLNENIKENISEIVDRVCTRTERFRFFSDLVVEYDIPRHLIDPNGSFKKFWNLTVSLILIYTAIVMPYRLAFSDPVYFDAGTTIELLVDVLFVMDIVTNFLTPFVQKTGRLETKMKAIALRYLKGWLFIDLTSSVPFSLIEYFFEDDSGYNYRYNTLFRLARIPKLYKLLRVARLAKMLKHLKDNQYVERIQEFLRMNSRVYKLLKFLATVCLCVHIFGCLWYFSAKLDQFAPETWVVRYGYLNTDNSTAYIASIYWAFTTITTVGYGDISAQTELEQFLSILWMIAGVGFYSVTIGSLSSFFSAIDTRNSVLASKLAAVHEFAKETGISKDIKDEIKRSIRYTNNKVGTVWSNKHSLFAEMPKNLKMNVASKLYNGLIATAWFFKNRDPSFVIAMLPLLKPMKYKTENYLYKEGMYADEMFFITRGRVNLVIHNDIVYKSFLKATHLGEIEIVLDLKYRENTAQVFGNSEFLVVARNELLTVLGRYTREHTSIVTLAWERRKKNAQAKQEVLECVKLKAKYGEIGFMAGLRTNSATDQIEPPPVESKQNLVHSMISNLQDRTGNLEFRVQELTDVIRTVTQQYTHKTS